MPVTITEFLENAGSRRGNSGQATRSYTIAGIDTSNGNAPITEEQLAEWLNDESGGLIVIPETVAGFGISDINYNESESIPGQYDTTITWNVPLNEIEYRFNFQARGGHFVQSLQTISAWGKGPSNFTEDIPTGLVAAIGPNFGGAINVIPSQDGPPKVEGIDAQPPPETFTLVYHTTDDVITKDYQLKLYDLCGKVNEEDFAELPAGSTMLVRVNGQKSRRIWTFEFGFGYVPNLTTDDDPLTIGVDISPSETITVTKKDGLDLLWVYRENEVEDSYGIVHPKPVAAYVERVWPRADLNDLNLPGIDSP